MKISLNALVASPPILNQSWNMSGLLLVSVGMTAAAAALDDGIAPHVIRVVAVSVDKVEVDDTTPNGEPAVLLAGTLLSSSLSLLSSSDG